MNIDRCWDAGRAVGWAEQGDKCCTVVVRDCGHDGKKKRVVHAQQPRVRLSTWTPSVMVMVVATASRSSTTGWRYWVAGWWLFDWSQHEVAGCGPPQPIQIQPTHTAAAPTGGNKHIPPRSALQRHSVPVYQMDPRFLRETVSSWTWLQAYLIIFDHQIISFAKRNSFRALYTRLHRLDPRCDQAGRLKLPECHFSDSATKPTMSTKYPKWLVSSRIVHRGCG